MSRYRFALRPKWIVSHVFVVAMVAAMVWAGAWQLNRLDQKRERNAKVTDRTAEPVAAISSLIEVGEGARAGDVQYRRAEATGRYQADQEVLVRSRSRDGAPGSWVLTPLQEDDGTTVVVNRGWIPNSGQLEVVPERFRAPRGTVSVVGLVQPGERRGSFGPRDPSEGTLTNLARADIARLDEQIPQDLLPVYLQLQTQEPAVTRSDPVPVPAPELDEGPHLSYALQWALFSVAALVFYPLILRRRAREVERDALEAELDEPDPADEPAPGDPRLDRVADR